MCKIEANRVMEDRLDPKSKSFEKYMVFTFTSTDCDVYYIDKKCIKHIHSL